MTTFADELREEIALRLQHAYYNRHTDGIAGVYAHALSVLENYTDEIMELITADRKRVALEARIDTATNILYGFSRTYKQEVTDSAGNVYVDESHGYISRYEVQELVAELKAQQEEV